MSINKSFYKLSVVAAALALSASAFAGPAIEVRPEVKPEVKTEGRVEGEAAKRVEGNKAIEATGRKTGVSIESQTKGRSELSTTTGAPVNTAAEKAATIKIQAVKAAEVKLSPAQKAEASEISKQMKLVKEVLGKEAVQNIAQGTKASGNAEIGTDLVIAANKLAQRVKAGTLQAETANLMVREQAEALADVNEPAYFTGMFSKACADMEGATLGRLARLMDARGSLEARGAKYLENATKEYGYEDRAAACKGEVVRGMKLEGKNQDGSASGCNLTGLYGKGVGVACARAR